jgi:hypothetical protein
LANQSLDLTPNLTRVELGPARCRPLIVILDISGGEQLPPLGEGGNLAAGGADIDSE